MLTSMSVRARWSVLALVITLGFLGYICAFKILDPDFWWHTVAGGIMVHTHQLISTEPFSYIRMGEAYKPRYEYLAQIVLYLLLHYGGVVGVIWWRIAMVAVSFVALLLFDKKSIWPNALLVIWVANINRAAYMDRPQLFSYLFFPIWVWLCFAYLDATEKKKKYWLLGSLVVLQIIWANFHGGTNILGVAVFGALVVARTWEWWQRPSTALKQEMKLLWGTLLFTGLAVMATPNLIGNYTYVLSLAHEKSNIYIKEWQPRPLVDYVKDLGPFWVMAIVSLWLGKKHRVFNALLMLGIGYLSLQSFRHGTFFFYVALATIFYQLKYYQPYQEFLNRILKYPWRVALGTALVVLGLFFFIQKYYTNELIINDYYGFGTADYGKDVYDFLEREHITGRMFNSYNIGGYFIYRGYQTRPVFIDGRNVDYGWDIMSAVMTARTDPQAWQNLDDQYHFDYAVVDYHAAGSTILPYVGVLQANPNWKLVYFDDSLAVYLKNDLANQKLITQLAYRYVSPLSVQAGTEFNVPADQVPAVKAELLRVAQSSPNSLQAKVVLGMYDVSTSDSAQGRELAQQLIATHPERPEGYEMLGISYADDHEWAQAGIALEESLKHTSISSPPVNYDYLAEVFSKAGDQPRADMYHKKSLQYPQPSAAPQATP